MREPINAARLFANSSHQRISAHRNPAWQSTDVHLKSVAQMVSSITNDEATIAAAWLHDIVEDTGVTIGDIERRFGPEVAKIVSDLTSPIPAFHRNGAVRGALDRQDFASLSAAAKTVKIADLIDTCRDLYKRDRASLQSYGAEAREMVQSLQGGDARLLARLKRDLEKYSSEIDSTVPAMSRTRLELTAFPITALRVFERAFTAQDIAEPLRSFDEDRSSKDVAAAMSEARLEIAGVRRNGVLCGFVEAARLKQGVCGEFCRVFVPNQVVVAESSLTQVIEVLTRHDWCFISAFGSVPGVISRVDVQKPAVRMWLFGIITVAELEFTERIRQKWTDESWIGLLSEERVKRAQHLRAERERRKEKCQLLDCLQLADKLEVLMSDRDTMAELGILTASAAKRASKQIESLRNSLAHAQDFVEQDWPQIVRLGRQIEGILSNRHRPTSGSAI